MLVIDPSSGSAGSMPGYALYFKGVLKESGTIKIDPKQPIQYRLNDLYNWCVDNHVDVLVIERIRGARAHEYLRWAVGVTICAVKALTVLEIPTTVWKIDARANEAYEKGDEQDALMMGEAVLRIAKEATSNVNYTAMLQRKTKAGSRTSTKPARKRVVK